MPSRRQARRLAIQAMFANDFLMEDVSAVARRVAKSVDVEVDHFCLELLQKATENKQQLENLILQNLQGWELNRIARLDKVLIILALTELLFFQDIPAEVTINETLELSKEFMNNKSSRFINGIVDTIFKNLVEENRINKKKIIKIPAEFRKKEHSS